MSTRKTTKSEKPKKAGGKKFAKSPTKTAWNLEKWKKFKNSPGKFINVETGGPLKITGAKANWNAGKDIIYEPKSLLAGPKREVQRVLEKIQNEPNLPESLRDENPKDLVNNAYSAENYEGNKNFDALVEKANESKKTGKKRKAQGKPVGEFNLDQLDEILTAIKESTKEGKKEKKEKKSPKRKAGAAPRKQRGGLSEVVKNALENGTAVDVSKLEKNGTGARRIKYPKSESKLKSVRGVEGFPIYAPNSKQFDMAIDQLKKKYPELSSLKGKWNSEVSGNTEDYFGMEPEEEERESPRRRKEEKKEEEKRRSRESSASRSPSPRRSRSKSPPKKSSSPVERLSAVKEIPAMTSGEAKRSAQATSPARRSASPKSEEPGAGRRMLERIRSRTVKGKKSPTREDDEDEIH